MFEEFRARLAAFAVGPAGEFRDHVQTGGCRCAGDQIPGDLDGPQHDTLHGARDVAEQTVLDGIVLRAARRVVGDADVAAQTAGQLTKVFLEPVLPIAVASPAVAEHQQARGMPVPPAA